MDDEHKKKMIAPIVITVIVVIYYMIYFWVLCGVLDSLIAKALFGIIPVVLAGTMVYVCIQRIKEIRSGEEDDISKY